MFLSDLRKPNDGFSFRHFYKPPFLRERGFLRKQRLTTKPEGRGNYTSLIRPACGKASTGKTVFVTIANSLARRSVKEDCVAGINREGKMDTTERVDPHQETALKADLKSLNDLLISPITSSTLQNWIDSLKSKLVFKGTVFGSIRWSKQMPPLLTPKHADAFQIALSHTETFIDYEGGAHLVTLIAPNLPPTKWDGPDDDEYYRVSFMSIGLDPEKLYTVRVTFTDKAVWTRGNLIRLVHAIEPPSQNFKIKDISSLDPFEVKQNLVNWL
jgi:hypothetical protein